MTSVHHLDRVVHVEPPGAVGEYHLEARVGLAVLPDCPLVRGFGQLRGPNRKYGTAFSGWQQQLVSRVGAECHHTRPTKEMACRQSGHGCIISSVSGAPHRAGLDHVQSDAQLEVVPV